MQSMLLVASALLAAIALAPALAHALELPGKLRLGREIYLAVQTIYYPGFTIAGFAEVAALLTTLVLTLVTPPASASFRLSAAAFACFAAMHLIFWTVVQPVNKHWLKNQDLRGSTEGSWTQLRNRWELAHLLRAVLAAIGLVCLLLALRRGACASS